MSTRSPFSTLPLSVPLYYSRITDNLSTDFLFNYYLVGFKPGFPLQASELNEIQEQFYVQQTLTTTCINNWWGIGNAGMGPFWEGATPLSPSNLSVTGGTGTTAPTITLSPGWLFVRSTSSTNITGGLGIWIYNPTTRIFNPSIITENTYGIWVKTETITANDDMGLTDNAGGGVRTGFGFMTNSADRISLYVSGSGTTNPDGVSQFYPILKTSLNGSTVKTINGYTIYTKI